MSDAPNKETEPFSFVDSEHEMMRLWQEQQIFQQSLRQTEDCPPYIFYDGPPFATGLPHHGHLVASTIKDIIPRYFTMQGRHVQRRFGWDCHGLPIEHEIDKSLGYDITLVSTSQEEDWRESGKSQQCGGRHSTSDIELSRSPSCGPPGPSFGPLCTRCPSPRSRHSPP